MRVRSPLCSIAAVSLLTASKMMTGDRFADDLLGRGRASIGVGLKHVLGDLGSDDTLLLFLDRAVRQGAAGRHHDLAGDIRDIAVVRQTVVVQAEFLEQLSVASAQGVRRL